MTGHRRARSSSLYGPDGRLHPMLRLLVYCVATPAAVIVVQVIAYTITNSIIGPPDQTSANLGEMGFPYLLSLQLASVIAITSTTLAVRRLLDGRSFVSLGLRRHDGWLSDMFFGLILGLLLMAVIFVVAWLAGWITWRPALAAFSLTDLVGVVALFIMVAWAEELAMRGYVLQTAKEAWGTIPALLLSSLIFGVLHLTNPGAGAMSAVGIFMAGVFFAVGFLATRSLWLPMAVHFSWNFFEGPFFGFPVSGLQLPSLLSVDMKGPELITGGAFGPEAGLSGILATCVGIAAVAAYWRWLKQRRQEPDRPGGKPQPGFDKA